MAEEAQVFLVCRILIIFAFSFETLFDAFVATVIYCICLAATTCQSEFNIPIKFQLRIALPLAERNKFANFQRLSNFSRAVAQEASLIVRFDCWWGKKLTFYV